MKKAFAVIGSSCLLAATVGLTACGSDEAKIHGIHAAIVSPENDYAFSRALADETTLFDDDYILQNGKHIIYRSDTPQAAAVNTPSCPPIK